MELPDEKREESKRTLSTLLVLATLSAFWIPLFVWLFRRMDWDVVVTSLDWAVLAFVIGFVVVALIVALVLVVIIVGAVFPPGFRGHRS